MALGLVKKETVLGSLHKSTQMPPKLLPLYSHHPSVQSPPDRARSKSNQDPCSFCAAHARTASYMVEDFPVD